MANTYTTNYSIVKSEIGANNDRWGHDLNDGLTTIDGKLVDKLEKNDAKPNTSTYISFANATISGDATNASTIFQNFDVGDVISISGSGENNDGEYTISSKTNAYTIVVTSGGNPASFTNETSNGSSPTINYSLVTKLGKVDIDGGSIDGTAVGANSHSTGKFTNLEITGDLTGPNFAYDSTTPADSTAGLVPAPDTSGDNAKFLKGDGTWSTPDNPLTADSVTTDKIADGNVTTAKIADADVTYAKIQNVASNKVLGNNTASAGSVTELSGSDVGSLIGNFSHNSSTPANSTSGLVPAPSTSGDNAKYLKGDGTWNEIEQPSVFTHDSGTVANSTSGLVPAPNTSGDDAKFLKGDGTWATPQIQSSGGTSLSMDSNSTNQGMQSVINMPMFCEITPTSTSRLYIFPIVKSSTNLFYKSHDHFCKITRTDSFQHVLFETIDTSDQYFTGPEGGKFYLLADGVNFVPVANATYLIEYTIVGAVRAESEYVATGGRGEINFTYNLMSNTSAPQENPNGTSIAGSWGTVIKYGDHTRELLGQPTLSLVT